MTWSLLEAHVLQFVDHNFKNDPIFVLTLFK